MTEPIYDYDPAQALDGPEAIAVFISDALETDAEPAYCAYPASYCPIPA